jgi:hypothetical protein
MVYAVYELLFHLSYSFVSDGDVVRCFTECCGDCRPHAVTGDATSPIFVDATQPSSDNQI